jgi:PAS domain-containing protein
MEPDDLAQEDYARYNYREMLSASPVPVVVLGEDLSILLVNRAFLTAFGLEDLPISPTINKILPSDRFD